MPYVGDRNLRQGLCSQETESIGKTRPMVTNKSEHNEECR